MPLPSLFIFLDESGNFDFSPKGTRHFVLTALSTTDPEEMAPALYRLKHELVLAGQDIEYFHAVDVKMAIANGEEVYQKGSGSSPSGAGERSFLALHESSTRWRDTTT